MITNGFFQQTLLSLDWQIQRKWPGFANPGRAKTCKIILCNPLRIRNILEDFISGLFQILNLETILWIALGEILGIVLGALPGLTATMGIALRLKQVG